MLTYDIESLDLYYKLLILQNDSPVHEESQLIKNVQKRKLHKMLRFDYRTEALYTLGISAVVMSPY